MDLHENEEKLGVYGRRVFDALNEQTRQYNSRWDRRLMRWLKRRLRRWPYNAKS